MLTPADIAQMTDEEIAAMKAQIGKKLVKRFIAKTIISTALVVSIHYAAKKIEDRIEEKD